MVAQKTAMTFLFLGAVAEGFRVKPKRKVAAKEWSKQVTEEPTIDEGLKMQVYTQAALELGRSMPSNDLVVSNTAECRLSQSDCSIGSMSGATVVYTEDDNSRCLNGDGFAFLVKPGARDKLLFFFPGGGACWKGSASNGELCTQDLAGGLGAAGLGSGVTENRANNGFADWTFVAPAYCDGGAFVSNSTLAGKPQDGYVNTNYAVQWAKQNLNADLANFVIAGSSAGALGTMAWSNYLLDTFQASKAAVIVDSYMGVFPSGTQGPTIKNFGACPLPIFADFKDACEREDVTIQDVFDFAIEQHPTVAFSMIQPKEDLVQRAFYAAIALTFGRISFLSGTGLYEASNGQKARYDRHDNFVHYIVDGSGHTFMASSSWYSTNTGDSSKPSMVDWANGLIEHQPTSSECNGPLQRNGGNAWLFKNTRYCFQELFPKSLSVSQ